MINFKEYLEEGKRGLWDNIHAKRKRIKAGSGERMRKPGSKGAPTDADFKAANEEVEQIDYLLEYPEDLQKMKKADSYKVGDKVFTKVGGKWHKGHVTTPLNKAGNHGVKFQHGGKTHSYVSSPEELRLHVEEVEQIDELEKKTVISYLNKADPSQGMRNAEKETPGILKNPNALRQYKKKVKAGVSRALDRLKPKQSVAEELTIDEQFDMIEEVIEQLAQAHSIDSESIWEMLESVDDTELLEYAIDKKGHKSSTGGLTQKGVDAYNRKTGGNLQTAVTTPPSKLKPDSKAAKRRKSFCARMGGVKGPMKDDKGRPTRKALALRKWNC